MQPREKRADWVAMALFVSLVIIGWLMIYAAGYSGQTGRSFFNLSSPSGKQLLFIGISTALFVATSLIDWKFWNTIAYPLYGLGIISLILVLVFGATIKGSTSWFTIGSFSIQPGEFAKFATCIGLASFMGYYKTDLRKFKYQLGAVAMLGFPALLILLQPDAGSALVFTSFFILLYRHGMPSWIYVVAIILFALIITALIYPPQMVIAITLLVGAIVANIHTKNQVIWILSLIALGLLEFFLYIPWGWLLGVNAAISAFCIIRRLNMRNERQILLLPPVLAVAAGLVFLAHYAFSDILEPHQQDRINVWLRPEQCDPRGSLYNVLQSKIAIGAGGLMGRGYLKGSMTNLNYVPEQTTDFIFSTIGEEQGFLGSAGIILLFTLLLLRIVAMAEHMRSPFCKAYAYGVFGIIFLHFFVNIGMTMGVVPIIGIPLPFVSYGGSSLLAFTLMMGVLFKMDRNRYQ
ncbi:MAG TPA: rod shape-determining protein RodA [Saprospiraceae bacterium]|nr:rod shape-determining protein RodA [Saprospiraceae bacterium]